MRITEVYDKERDHFAERWEIVDTSIEPPGVKDVVISRREP